MCTHTLSIGMLLLITPHFSLANTATPSFPSKISTITPSGKQSKLASSSTQPSDTHLLSIPSDQSSTEFIPTTASRMALEGNTAFAQGNFRKAADAYQEVLRLAPNNLVGLVNLGVAQSRLGDATSAEKTLKHALSLRLETGLAWLTLGTLYMNQDRLDEAFAALAEARVYDAQNPHVHNYLGVVMNRMGWSDAAETELRTAVELDTAYSDAHYNLAVVYMTRNPPAVELAKRHYYIAIKCGARRDANMEKSFHYTSPEVSHSLK